MQTLLRHVINPVAESRRRFRAGRFAVNYEAVIIRFMTFRCFVLAATACDFVFLGHPGTTPLHLRHTSVTLRLPLLDKPTVRYVFLLRVSQRWRVMA